MHRHIIHVHIPAFPIAVARVCHPDLLDRPVAVAPLHSERSLILSASLEARREGVFKGMPLGKAMKFCPDLKVLPPDPNLTGKACQGLAKVVSRYTPLWEPSRPGHIYLDVTGTNRLWGRAKDTAGRLSREIQSQLALPGTAGVAGNKMISSIASRMSPSGGVVDVDHGRESSFIAPLKVYVLPGIGPVRRKILLEELSITLVRQIAVLDMNSLSLVFGREAYVIHQRALGIDLTPVYPPSMEPTIAEELTLPEDENDEAKLLGILYGLVERCAYQIRRRTLFPRKAGLMFRYADQQEVIRRMSLSHRGFWDFMLYKPLEELFLRACERRVRIRHMRVWFRDFSPPDPQLRLFTQGSPHMKKMGMLTPAMDRIREKYGSALVHYGKTTDITTESQRSQRTPLFVRSGDTDRTKEVLFQNISRQKG